jgi:hypothetical protein
VIIILLGGFMMKNPLKTTTVDKYIKIMKYVYELDGLEFEELGALLEYKYTKELELLLGCKDVAHVLVHPENLQNLIDILTRYQQELDN